VCRSCRRHWNAIGVSSFLGLLCSVIPCDARPDTAELMQIDLRYVVHRTRLALVLLALCVSSSCGAEVTGPSEQAASPELVQQACAAYAAYVQACQVETDGFGEEACNVLFAKYYRSDVLEAQRRCSAAAANDCAAHDDCGELATRALGLTVEQRQDDPLLKACGARFDACSGRVGSLPARCNRVLLYTSEGRERVEHCFGEAVSCSNTTDCVRFPDLF
jgi:hypothetical protein